MRCRVSARERRLAHRGAQFVARANQFLREALQVHQRRAQIVRHAVDEHFVFLGLLTQGLVDPRQFAGPARKVGPEARLDALGFEQTPAGLVQGQIEARDFVAAEADRRQRLVAREAPGVVGRGPRAARARRA